MRERLLWALAGCLAADAVVLVLHLLTGRGGWHGFVVLALSGASLALYYGERTGRLEPIERLTRPTTIFDGKIPRT